MLLIASGVAEKTLERLPNASIAQSSPLAQRWPAHAIEEQTAVLAAIDGVGQSKAKALIEAFGNLSSVFSATPEAMSDIKTIGPVTAMNVHQVLHGV